MRSLCLPACRRPPPGVLLAGVTAKLAWIKPAHLEAFNAARTTAHRIGSGPDGWIERLGDDALLCFKHEDCKAQMLQDLAEWAALAHWEPRRIFGKFLPRQNDERIAPQLLAGADLPLTTVVEEGGARYGIDFGAGYSHGLFLDQRGNRAFIRRTRPRRILNTFAYTCSFSLVAALEGGETVSIDLSRKSLDRGKENFSLNGIDSGARHRFLADDVLEVLPRLARRGEKFDAIILDPPTFSRGNDGRRWQVEQHFEDLLTAALEVASPGCRLLLSTNCSKLDPRALERTARYCLKVHRRSGEFHREGALPDFPPGHGASTIWLLAR